MFGMGPTHVQTDSGKAKLSVCSSDQWMWRESNIYFLETTEGAQLLFLKEASLPQSLVSAIQHLSSSTEMSLLPLKKS